MRIVTGTFSHETNTIEVDAPGITSPRLERYPYKNIRRPIYPLDTV